jgi:hypothetical protein
VTPRIVHRNGVATIALNWEDRPVALTPEAQRTVLSLCAKHDALSCRVSQGGIHVRTDAGSGSTLHKQVGEVLSRPDAWKPIPQHPRFPCELLVVRGTGDAREWDYEQQLSPAEVMYESAGT